mmetsp:Transcript_24358/g.73097  ORF Transcript_24358/g.73097 Transcript_24358/m.73097 type:complete len:125 (-) Transcript_24358:30-404(-)
MGAIFSAKASNMWAEPGGEGVMPWFLQCDGHYTSQTPAKHGWFRLEGHGALYAKRDGDAPDPGAEGEWEAVDADTIRLAVGGDVYLMRAVDDVHNTVTLTPEAGGDAVVYAFIDEEGTFAEAYR